MGTLRDAWINPKFIKHELNILLEGTSEIKRKRLAIEHVDAVIEEVEK